MSQIILCCLEIASTGKTNPLLFTLASGRLLGQGRKLASSSPAYHRHGILLSWCSIWNFLSWFSTIHTDLSSPAFEASIRMVLLCTAHSIQLLSYFEVPVSHMPPQYNTVRSFTATGPVRNCHLNCLSHLNCLRWGAGAAVAVAVIV